MVEIVLLLSLTGTFANTPAFAEPTNSRTAKSADGKYKLTASGPTAILCETASGKELHTFKGKGEIGIQCVALSADGKKAFIVDSDGATQEYHVIVWDAVSGKKLLTFQVLSSQLQRAKLGKRTTWVTAVAVSANGDQIITGGEDGTTTLWDSATGKVIHNFPGPVGEGHLITRVGLSADGRTAWSVTHDGTTREWDTKTGKRK
jgi:WD40 repeat protein